MKKTNLPPYSSPKMDNQCTIGKLIYENCNFLKILAKTRSIEKRSDILIQVNPSQLLALVEICLNILQNKFKLTVRQKRRMHPYRNFIRRLSRVRTEKGAKKLVFEEAAA